MFGAYALVLAALRLASAASVAAVRESSIVIAVALAALVLREPVGRWRFAGAALVAAGVAVIALVLGTRARESATSVAAGKARRRSGSRRRSARRARRRSPGSRSRPRGPPIRRPRRTPRSRFRQRPERHRRHLSLELLPVVVRRQSPETTSCVRPASRRASPSPRRRRGLPKHDAVEDDDRVDAEHRVSAAVDRARLPDRVLDRDRRRPPRSRRDDPKRDLQLLEDRPALRGRGGEDDHRKFRASSDV